jgi:hypothetical protein
MSPRPGLKAGLAMSTLADAFTALLGSRRGTLTGAGALSDPRDHLLGPGHQPWRQQGEALLAQAHCLLPGADWSGPLFATTAPIADTLSILRECGREDYAHELGALAGAAMRQPAAPKAQLAAATAALAIVANGIAEVAVIHDLYRPWQTHVTGMFLAEPPLFGDDGRR